ncbi:MAG: hypothetical protein HQL51_01655 [Magnetococcales bacterium]|nr:hypothetical protein [Magnetococcales bacterium]
MSLIRLDPFQRVVGIRGDITIYPITGGEIIHEITSVEYERVTLRGWGTPFVDYDEHIGLEFSGHLVPYTIEVDYPARLAWKRFDLHGASIDCVNLDIVTGRKTGAYLTQSSFRDLMKSSSRKYLATGVEERLEVSAEIYASLLFRIGSTDFLGIQIRHTHGSVFSPPMSSVSGHVYEEIPIAGPLVFQEFLFNGRDFTVNNGKKLVGFARFTDQNGQTGVGFAVR